MERILRGGATRERTGMKRARIDWIDLAKGLMMFVVILAHTLERNGGAGELVRDLAFSIHMPFFFVLSGMTYRPASDAETWAANTKRAARHLVAPMFIVYGIRILWHILRQPGRLISGAFWKKEALTILFFNGARFEEFGRTIPSVGIVWFFAALFLCRVIYDRIQFAVGKRLLPVICALISVGGVWIGRRCHLPFSLDVALAVVPFLYAGALMRGRRMPEGAACLLRAALFGAGWVIAFFIGYRITGGPLELVDRAYPLYPLCFLAALLGTAAVCLASAWLLPLLGRLARLILYIGRNSLYLLCVHCLDNLIWVRLWDRSGNQWIRAGAKIVVDLAIFAVFMGVRHLIQSRRAGK